MGWPGNLTPFSTKGKCFGERHAHLPAHSSAPSHSSWQGTHGEGPSLEPPPLLLSSPELVSLAAPTAKTESGLRAPLLARTCPWQDHLPDGWGQQGRSWGSKLGGHGSSAHTAGLWTAALPRTPEPGPQMCSLPKALSESEQTAETLMCSDVPLTWALVVLLLCLSWCHVDVPPATSPASEHRSEDAGTSRL